LALASALPSYLIFFIQKIETEKISWPFTKMKKNCKKIGGVESNQGF